MIQLSQSYDREYNKPIMRKLRCSIKWGIINPTAASNNTASSANQAPFSNIKNHTLSNTVLPNTQYGTFEQDFWDLTGAMKLVPNNDEYGEIGWISQSISNLDGSFDTPPILNIAFGVPVSLYGLLIDFSIYKQEYAVDFDLKVSIHENSDQIIEVRDNAQYSFTTNLAIENITNIEIKVLKWSEAGRRARLCELEFGLYKFYTGKDLVDVSEVKPFNQVSSQLPIGSLTFVVLDREDLFNQDNTEGIAAYLTQRQPVEVTYEQMTDDGWETIAGGIYYLRDWLDDDSRIKYKLIAESLISFMDKPYYNGKYYAGGILVKDEMENVLNSAFPLESGLNGKWDLEAVPSDIRLYMPLPIKLYGNYLTHKDCLQMLAQYAGCVVSENELGLIVVKPLSYENSRQTSFNGSTDYLVQLRHIFENPPKAQLKSVLKQVDCAYKSITVAESATQVYFGQGLVVVKDSPYIFEYAVNNSSIAVNNSTVSVTVKISGTETIVSSYEVEKNGYATIITFDNSGIYDITITAQVLNVYNNITTKYNTADPNYHNGQVVTINNDIVSSKARADAIIDGYIKELFFREEYTIKVKRDMRPDVADIVKLEKATIKSALPLEPIDVRITEIQRSLMSATQRIKMRKVEVE